MWNVLRPYKKYYHVKTWKYIDLTINVTRSMFIERQQYCNSVILCNIAINEKPDASDQMQNTKKQKTDSYQQLYPAVLQMGHQGAV